MTSDPNCLFCKIVNGDIPSTGVYEDSEVIAFRDINPGAPTHILVVPRTHIPSISDVSAADAPLVAKLLQVAAQIAASEGVADSGFRLVINTGKDGGQSVFHLHVHLLAGRALAWPPG